MSTLSDLIIAAQERMSQMSGLGVQTYAQPKLVRIAQAKFNFLFDELWWKDYCTTETFAIGVDGLIVADIAAKIKRFIDVQYVWWETETNPLPELTSMTNPTAVTMRCFEAYGLNNKILRILPLNVTGNITVRYRTKPNNFVDTDTIKMDADLLINGMCAEYLLAEGANMGLADQFNSMYQGRFEQLRKLEQKNTKSMYSYTASGVTEWRDR